MLSDSESDTETAHQITINEHYAKAFQYRKEREELEQLKAKYGSDYEVGDADENEETDSESAESEDEDGDELTPALDAAILRTLARIKQRDPAIYISEKNIFGEEQSRASALKPATKATKVKESKPVTLRQVRLESQLNPASRSPSLEPTHVEAQRELRDETLAVFHAGDDDNDDDDLFVPREKTKDELEKEQEEYKTFLQREVGQDLSSLIGFDKTDVDHADDASAPSEKKKKKSVQDTKSKEDENQAFLINYILNRGWIDQSSKHVPTYHEITAHGKAKAKQHDSDDETNQRPTAFSDVDDEEFEDTIDRFEVSYNYRFEEPDALEIKSFPRNLSSIVRREDTTRKDARERKKQRKAEELKVKKEEVKRLKSLKMKEIRAKLDKIGRQGGKNFDDDAALHELDLDADWDPDTHDAQMTSLYGEDAEYNEDEKPTWDDDIDTGNIATFEEEDQVERKSKKKKKKKKKDGDDDLEGGVDVDFMDADVDLGDEEWDGTEEMRKRKLDKYLDELYELDFNDMTGGTKTKFRYVPVQAQTYALTPAEILMATDAELNEYMGVKKYAPYRKDQWDSGRNDKLKDLKSKISERMGGKVMESLAASDNKPMKKRKGKKERMRAKLEEVDEEGDETQSTTALMVAVDGTKRKREEDVADSSQLHAKKKKRRHKKKMDGLQTTS